MTASSRRQRNRDAARASVIEISQRLFRTQGYDATTLDQICAEAKISVPTLLAYFESKDRLALAPEYDGLAEFRAMIEDPARTVDTLTLWRQRVAEGTGWVAGQPQTYIRHIRFQGASPAVMRGLLQMIREYEDVLAAGLARDFGLGPEGNATTDLMATALAFANDRVVRRWAAEGGVDDLTQRCLAIVDLVIATFGDGRSPQ